VERDELSNANTSGQGPGRSRDTALSSRSFVRARVVAARAIEVAIETVIAELEGRTPDPSASTAGVAAAIAHVVANGREI